jgi:transcriptional regulator with XRE-family HTH domain
MVIPEPRQLTGGALGECVRSTAMDRYRQVEARWSEDLEATVAKNVWRLRESRAISQEQLAADLFGPGAEMLHSCVSQLEAGEKPLRLNEVAAIAAYFEVPIEALWQDAAEISDERLLAERNEESASQKTADYYNRERMERLRNKLVK